MQPPGKLRGIDSLLSVAAHSLREHDSRAGDNIALPHDPSYFIFSKFLSNIAPTLHSEGERKDFIIALLGGPMIAKSYAMMRRDLVGSEDTLSASFFGNMCEEAGIKDIESTKFDDQAWERLIEIIEKRLHYYNVTMEDSRVLANIEVFASEFRFSQPQAECLKLLYATSNIGIFRALVDSLGRRVGLTRAIAAGLGCETNEIKASIDNDGYFYTRGILVRQERFTVDDYEALGTLNLKIKSLLRTGSVALGDFTKLLLGKNQQTPLMKDDFDYLDPAEVDLLYALIKKSTPFLIFVGDVGTGKSQFAKRAAEDLGCQCIFAGGTNDGEVTDRAQQIADIRLKYSIACQRQNILLVIDDAEKLMANKFGSINEKDYTDKAFLNELVENPKCAILFTCNELPFDRSVIRRAKLIVTFPQADEDFQRRLLKRIAARLNFALTSGQITELTNRYAPVQPALLETAIANAVATGNPHSIDTTLRSLTRYVNGTSRPRQPIPDAPFSYDPDFYRFETNGITGDVASLLGKTQKPFSCLIYGDPGNGQETLLVEIANKLDRKPCYVLSGSLEFKAIRSYFERCYDENKILILDDTASDKTASPLEKLDFTQEIARNLRRQDVHFMLVTSPNVATRYVDCCDHVLGVLAPEKKQVDAISQKLFGGVPLPVVTDATLSDYMRIAMTFAVAANEATDGRSTSELLVSITDSMDSAFPSF